MTMINPKNILILLSIILAVMSYFGTPTLAPSVILLGIANLIP